MTAGGATPEPPGAQEERTSLAWVRTALGLAGCALLLVRLALVRDVAWAVGAALAAALVAVGVLGWAHDRYRRAARSPGGRRATAAAVPALVLTVVAGVVGALGLLLVLT